MRRASLELHAVLPKQTVIVNDAVATNPSLRVLFLEYNKFLTRWIALL
jgi:hypothetical protein